MANQHCCSLNGEALFDFTVKGDIPIGFYQSLPFSNSEELKRKHDFFRSVDLDHSVLYRLAEELF